MIYQFEHEKIKLCEDCKLCDLNFDWCNMQRCLINKYQSPKFNNCPLVAISKTETTSCEYCDGKEKPLHCLRGEHGESVCVGVSKSGGYVSVQKDGDNTLYAINYCPNCGRRLEEKRHET